jgi:hypothetical protein
MKYEKSAGKREGFVELRFAAKPSEAVREALKAAGFRWASSEGCWYGLEARLPELQEGPASSDVVGELRAELERMRADVSALRGELATMKRAPVAVVPAAPVQSAPVAKAAPVRSAAPVAKAAVKLPGAIAGGAGIWS